MKKTIVSRKAENKTLASQDKARFEKMLGTLEKKQPSGATFSPATCSRFVYCV